jgi:O-methyltransferase domain
LARGVFKCIKIYYGDAYLLRVILHDWNDDNALSILIKCREAMSLGSKLIIIERIICDDENKSSTYLGDINMLITIGGKERTENEFKKLFNEAGFKLNKLVLTKSVFSILECEPV